MTGIHLVPGSPEGLPSTRIHRSLVYSPHKGQWRGVWCFILFFSNKRFSKNRDAGDFRRRRTHYGVIVMESNSQRAYGLILDMLLKHFVFTVSMLLQATVLRVHVMDTLKQKLRHIEEIFLFGVDNPGAASDKISSKWHFCFSVIWLNRSCSNYCATRFKCLKWNLTIISHQSHSLSIDKR